MKKMNLKMQDGKLCIKDNETGSLEKSSFSEKHSNSGIVYCNYVPVQLTEADAEKHLRVSRAGKTYAKVKLSHPNPHYRGKRGIIWDRKDNQCLLEIETMNITYENGCSTWIGVIYPNGYTKIWFPKDELENFEEYDENGNLIGTIQL